MRAAHLAISYRYRFASDVVVNLIGYRRPGADFRELELQPLDAKRRRTFLARWFGRATVDGIRMSEHTHRSCGPPYISSQTPLLASA